MSEWKVKIYQLSELGDISRGRSRHRPRDDKSLYGGKYPFIQTGDVKNANFYLANYTQTYSDKGLAQSKLWKAGTLCITIAANIAETAILAIDACFPDSIVGFIPYEGVSDVRYVKYYFDIYKKQMQAMSLGATQDNFSVDKMLKVKFAFPDYPTQTRIANILSAYDDAIENNNRRIALLEKAARELYREWFVRLRFPGYEDAKFVNGLPEGWEIVRLSQLFSTTSGGTPSRQHPEYYQNGVVPWIKTGELNNRFVLETEEKITLQAIKNSSAKIIKDDSLIIAMYGATIGQMGFTVGEMACNQACCVFLPRSINYSKEFLFYWMQQNLEYIIGLGFGAAQQNLSQDLISKLKIIKPKEEIVVAFTKIIKICMQQIRMLQYQSQNLARQRDLLLPRLMSGKLEV